MSNSAEVSERWDINAARNLYNIHRWGAKYFDINEAGKVVAKPLRDSGASVDLTDVIEEAKARGLKFPIKANQARHVVEAMLDTGKPFDFALEVGSKPALFAAIALDTQLGT